MSTTLHPPEVVMDSTRSITGPGSDSPRTTIPQRFGGRPPLRPRRIVSVRQSDLYSILGALAASISTTALLWTAVSPFTGVVGFVITAWCLFLLIYAVLVSFDESGPAVRDRLASVVVHSLGGLLLAVLGLVIVYTFWRGWTALVHANFFTQDLRSTGPTDPLTKGGLRHAIIGTLIEVGIALAIAVPLGLLAAVFLHEVPGRFAQFVRTVVEAMTALPDVLAGLFIYATLILTFGVGQSGFAAATALAVTILPIIIRASDVVLRLVPGGLTEASYALGAGQWRTVLRVTLPTARSGLATAVILGAARAIGETSPVLLTAGATGYTNTDPVNGPMMSLPLLAFLGVQSPEHNERARGFGSAAVLLVLVVVLFVIGRTIGGRGAGNLSTRQQRRRLSASRRDARRFEQRSHSPALPNSDDLAKESS